MPEEDKKVENVTLLQGVLAAAMLLGLLGVVQGLRLVQRVNAANPDVLEKPAVVREILHIGWFSSRVVLSIPLEDTALHIPCRLPRGRLNGRRIRETDVVTALWHRCAMEAVAARTVWIGQMLLTAGFAVMICTVLVYVMLF